MRRYEIGHRLDQPTRVEGAFWTIAIIAAHLFLTIYAHTPAQSERAIKRK